MTKKIQQQLIASLFVLIAIIFIYINYLYKPINIKYNQIFDELNTTLLKLKDTKARALELPKLQYEMKILEQEVSDLEKLLPKEREIPDLIRTINKTALAFQLQITNLQPLAIITQNNYFEIPFRLTLKGTYHSLGSFLAELGQEQRILNSCSLVLSGMMPSKTDPSTINANFELRAYTFRQ